MGDRGQRVLVTGASGYIGGRLVPRLLAAGYRVRCVVRSARKLAGRPFVDDPRVEVVEVDVGDTERLTAAMRGCGPAYFLVHSMLVAGRDYAAVDGRIARSFAAAAQRAGLSRIVYLGGLGETGTGLSEHLRSRRAVEHELASGTVPVTVLRAAMIIGSGSASFEILRYLVERLPVMVTPRWVHTRCQPIAVDDVLGYLVRCLALPATAGRTLDIGGPEIATYAEMIRCTAEALGLRRRLIVPVPVLTPRLSSLWIHLVTPISSRIARPLAEGLRNEVVCRDDEADRLMPGTRLSIAESIRLAVAGHGSDSVETRWTDAGAMPGDPEWAGGKTFVDARQLEIDAPAAAVFRAVCRVGGAHGWYASDWLWRLRGLLDKLAGGPGLRRGRRNAEAVRCGDALDFWRVVAVETDRRLLLHAEMKLPGVATLSFELEPLGAGRTRLRQTAKFRPRGLAGLAYWYAVLPLHGIVFRGMLRGIRRAASEVPAAGIRSCSPPRTRPPCPDPQPRGAPTPSPRARAGSSRS